MNCFRHDPGKICPDCGLDRRNKMKMRVQAQHLQAGDIVGSGERIIGVLLNSTKFASNKVLVTLRKGKTGCRSIQWGKYTMINIERPEKESV